MVALGVTVRLELQHGGAGPVDSFVYREIKSRYPNPFGSWGDQLVYKLLAEWASVRQVPSEWQHAYSLESVLRILEDPVRVRLHRNSPVIVRVQTTPDIQCRRLLKLTSKDSVHPGCL